MRKKKFKNIGRKKAEAFEVDITSLLDILVILLVFLLKSYNPTDLKLDLKKGITLPNSRSEVLGGHAIIIQVNKERDLFVNNKIVGKVDALGGVIEGLRKELEVIRDAEKVEREKNPRRLANLSLKKINLVFDQKTPYKTLKDVMHTSAIVGFNEFKFIVARKL